MFSKLHQSCIDRISISHSLLRSLVPIRFIQSPRFLSLVTLHNKVNKILICSFICFMLACGSRVKKAGETPAESLYLDGMEALKDQDYLTAFEIFQEVKTKFIYTPYAALAELRIADTELGQESYVAAIDSYRFFIQSRPNHKNVPYAFWKVAQSYNKQRPSKIFILPPDYEREQGSTLDTLKAVTTYIERYPKHKYIKNAQKIFTSCRQYLAKHELYVADFYRQQEQSKAAIGRYLQVFDDYQDLPVLWTRSAKALKALYLAQGEKQLAKNVQVKLDQLQAKKRKSKQTQKTKSKKTKSKKTKSKKTKSKE
jgi:outer membrane protein assembly factor BamD